MFGLFFILIISFVHDIEPINPGFKHNLTDCKNATKKPTKTPTLFTNTRLLATKLYQYLNNQAAETEKMPIIVNNQDPHIH